MRLPFLQHIINFLGLLGAIILAFAMLLTTADVVLRYFFHSPLSGVYEIIELLMGILSPVAILYCSSRRGHVSVEIFYNMLASGPRKVVLLFSLLCSLAVFAVLGWQGWMLVLEVTEARLCTPILELPMWPAAWAIFIAFVLVIPVILTEIIQACTAGEVRS